MLKIIAVYNSNHDTLEAEQILKQHQIPIRPIIKPRKISSSCALALEFDFKNRQKVVEISDTHKLSLIGFFQKSDSGWNML